MGGERKRDQECGVEIVLKDVKMSGKGDGSLTQVQPVVNIEENQRQQSELEKVEDNNNVKHWG